MIYLESGLTSTYGANHPRIGWNSITRRGTLAASSEATGFEATNAASPLEYSYWKATSTASQTLTLTFDATETVNFVGISGHNLGSTGATVQAQQNSAGWTNIGPSVSPTDDSPIAILLDNRNLSEIRITVSGGSAAPYLAVFYVCEAIEFPTRTYAGQGAPANMARNTEYMNNESVDGKWLGRSIKRMRNRVDVPIRHLSETWVAANFDAFAEDARSYPYFLCPRPNDYPSDVQFKWSTNDIVPQRMGIGSALMEVTV